MCAKKKMFDVAARRIVAFMAYKQSVRDRAIGKFPSKSMGYFTGGFSGFATRYKSISEFVAVGPFQASGSQIRNKAFVKSFLPILTTMLVAARRATIFAWPTTRGKREWLLAKEAGIVDDHGDSSQKGFVVLETGALQRVRFCL